MRAPDRRRCGSCRALPSVPQDAAPFEAGAVERAAQRIEDQQLDALAHLRGNVLVGERGDELRDLAGVEDCRRYARTFVPASSRRDAPRRVGKGAGYVALYSKSRRAHAESVCGAQRLASALPSALAHRGRAIQSRLVSSSSPCRRSNIAFIAFAVAVARQHQEFVTHSLIERVFAACP